MLKAGAFIAKLSMKWIRRRKMNFFESIKDFFPPFITSTDGFQDFFLKYFQEEACNLVFLSKWFVSNT